MRKPKGNKLEEVREFQSREFWDLQQVAVCSSLLVI